MKAQINADREVALVLLAAGSSSRFQGNKLLHRFQGKPMYRHVVDQIQAIAPKLFAKKLVVTQYEELADDLQREGFVVVRNMEPELGISHSIQLALEALGETQLYRKKMVEGEAGDSDGENVDGRQLAVCFGVCDQPYLRGKTIQLLIEEWRKSGKGMGCLGYDGELGNPAVFAYKYLEELSQLTGDVGGKKVIRRHMEDLFVLEVEDEKELRDIDVKADMTGEIDG